MAGTERVIEGEVNWQLWLTSRYSKQIGFYIISKPSQHLPILKADQLVGDLACRQRGRQSTVMSPRTRETVIAIGRWCTSWSSIYIDMRLLGGAAEIVQRLLFGEWNWIRCFGEGESEGQRRWIRRSRAEKIAQSGAGLNGFEEVQFRVGSISLRALTRR